MSFVVIWEMLEFFTKFNWFTAGSLSADCVCWITRCRFQLDAAMVQTRRRSIAEVDLDLVSEFDSDLDLGQACIWIRWVGSLGFGFGLDLICSLFGSPRSLVFV